MAFNNKLYLIKKNLYSTWHKYNLSSNSSQLFTMFLVVIIVWLIGSTLTVINEYFFGQSTEQHIYNYLKFYTLTIKTILSADFGDFEEYTNLTLILSIIMVVVGIVVIGLFTGQIISMLIAAIEKNKFLPEKPYLFCFKNPVLICNYSSKVKEIVLELKNNNLLEDREIIIINEKADQYEIEDKKLFKNVYYIKGNPVDISIINNALSNNHKSYKKRIVSEQVNAIVLREESENHNYTDYKAIETALALEAYNSKIQTIVELINPEFKYYFTNTVIDELITVKDYGIKLLAQSALNNGITKVYDELLIKSNNNNEKEKVKLNSIYISIISEFTDFNKISFSELKTILEIDQKKDIILIGFQKYFDPLIINQIKNDYENFKIESKLNKSNYFEQVNPPKKCNIVIGDYYFYFSDNKLFLSNNTKLTEKDKIIYISKQKLKKEKNHGKHPGSR